MYCQSIKGSWNQGFGQTINLNAGKDRVIRYNLPTGTTKVYFKLKIITQWGNEASDFLSLFQNSTDPKIKIASFIGEKAIKASDPKISFNAFFNSNGLQYNCINSNGIITGVFLSSISEDECIKVDYLEKNFIDFNIKNENSLFNLKVVFEIVPFVDYELSRGWSKSIKNELYNFLLKNLNENNEFNLSKNQIEELTRCFLTNVVTDYTYRDFLNLAEFEKKNYIEKLKRNCNQ